MISLTKINKILFLLIAFLTINYVVIFADTPVTLYTPEGCPVTDTYIMSPGTPWFTDQQAQNAIDFWSLNAEIIKTATVLYNCHGYAWVKSEDMGTYWVGYSGNDPELAYFSDGAWANDGLPSYLPASASEATQACYEPHSDHSVRVIQNRVPAK